MPSVQVVYESYPKISLDEFVPELAFEFPEVPADAFSNYLMRTIIRFARETNALRRVAHIVVQECVENYLLEPADCMDIVNIMSVCQTKYGSCSSRPVTRLMAEPCHICCGVYSWFEYPNTIYFKPARQNDHYRVEFSVTPTYDTCEVDKILMTHYYDVITEGVRFQLLNMVQKPWITTSRLVDKATESEKRFILGMRQAAIDAMTHNQRGAIRAKRGRVI